MPFSVHEYEATARKVLSPLWSSVAAMAELVQPCQRVYSRITESTAGRKREDGGGWENEDGGEEEIERGREGWGRVDEGSGDGREGRPERGGRVHAC